MFANIRTVTVRTHRDEVTSCQQTSLLSASLLPVSSLLLSLGRDARAFGSWSHPSCRAAGCVCGCLCLGVCVCVCVRVCVYLRRRLLAGLLIVLGLFVLLAALRQVGVVGQTGQQRRHHGTGVHLLLQTHTHTHRLISEHTHQDTL